MRDKTEGLGRLRGNRRAGGRIVDGGYTAQ